MSGLAVDTAGFEVVNGPKQYAQKLATYISDPSRIRALTVREYGERLAPPLNRCARYREDYLRQRDEFRALAERQAGNDNGDVFRVRGLVPALKPVPTPKAVVRKRERPASPARERARVAALRNEKAVRPGPIARGIIEAVAGYFELYPEDITGGDRSGELVSARFVAIRLLSDLLDHAGNPRFSKAQIGRIMGGRDHSTILHAVHTFNDRARKYPEMIQAYHELSQ